MASVVSSIPVGSVGHRQAAPRRLRLVPCDDPMLWNRLVTALPGGSAFHEWSFLDLQQRLLGVRIERLTAVHDDRPVAAVPLARRPAPALRAPWLPFPMLGPAVDPRLLLPVLRALRRFQAGHAMPLARFDLGPELVQAGVVAVHGAGMTGRRDGTVRLDLGHGDLAELDARMHRSRRQHIARALRRGVTARAAQPGELAEVLDDALTEAYARRGASSPYPAGTAERIESWAAGRDDVHLGVVVVDGRLLGATVLLGTHPVAAGWVGACLPAARGCSADAVLLRSAFRWALQRGHRGVDFGGRVGDSVEEYKRSFGGTAAAYLTVESLVAPPPAGALLTAARALVGRR